MPPWPGMWAMKPEELGQSAGWGWPIAVLAAAALCLPALGQRVLYHVDEVRYLLLVQGMVEDGQKLTLAALLVGGGTLVGTALRAGRILPGVAVLWLTMGVLLLYHQTRVVIPHYNRIYDVKGLAAHISARAGPPAELVAFRHPLNLAYRLYSGRAVTDIHHPAELMALLQARCPVSVLAHEPGWRQFQEASGKTWPVVDRAEIAGVTELLGTNAGTASCPARVDPSRVEPGWTFSINTARRPSALSPPGDTPTPGGTWGRWAMVLPVGQRSIRAHGLSLASPPTSRPPRSSAPSPEVAGAPEQAQGVVTAKEVAHVWDRLPGVDGDLPDRAAVVRSPEAPRARAGPRQVGEGVQEGVGGRRLR